MRIAWLVTAQAAGILCADLEFSSRPLVYAIGAFALAAACVWPRGRGTCACLMAACAGAAGLGAQLDAARQMQRWAGRQGVLEASVAGLERTHWGWRAELRDIAWLGAPMRRLPGRLRLSGEAAPPGVPPFAALRPGDRVRAAVRLAPLGGLRNPGRPDPRRAARRAGIGLSARLEHPALHARVAEGRLAALHAVRARLAREFADAGPGGALLAALAVGERGHIAPATRQAFAELGISHLLAVSGLHLGLAVMLAFGAVRRGLVRLPGWVQCRDPRVPALLAASAVALGYALLCGWGVPVRRALVLLFALGVGAARGRPTERLAPLWCAASWILASEPQALFSAGAQLSFAASATLLVATARSHAGARFGLLATTATALAATAPLAALHFGSRAPLALLANAVSVPWTAGVLLPATLASSAALALELPGYAHGVAAAEALAAWSVSAVRWAAGHLPSTVSAAPPALGWVAASALLGLLALRVRGLPGRIVLAAGVSMLLAAAPDRRIGPERPRALFLDVGQGDAALVQGRAAAVLIDAGGRLPGGADLGGIAVVPALRALGVQRLELVVVSHADLDHRGGIGTLLEALPIDALWLPLGAARDPAFARLRALALRRGVRWEERGAGDAAVELGRLRVTPLWPARDFEGSRNDRSLVVRVETEAGSLLFPGDLEAAGEAALLASDAELASDVLKLPHHGSRTSSTLAFLRAVSPDLVVATAPCRSRFGMPHAEVVGRVARRGAAFWWTGRDGAVWVRLAGPLASWSTARSLDCPRPERGG
ncbi:MAG: DNA internalization-related competence protein ComEC/Rec2 [Deltaproteobacteria bacterium]|nr:DNA internalization-related competence protein ComEC/Rec2 [Deltaproteobacteria bacterium]